jgi:ABC-type dipeptide/oligopeptide/nickel transport system permease component
MRLRQYLVRRGIQTFITLVVFLVILFAIFRLMPGDPTRLFTVPGQPQEARDEICVSFGLCKRVPQEGHAFETSFDTGTPGPYAFHVWLNDSAGNSNLTYFSHTKPKTFLANAAIRILSITTDRDSWAYRSSDQVQITANMTWPPLTTPMAWANFSDELGNLLAVNLTMEPGSGKEFSVNYTPPGIGAYVVKVSIVAGVNSTDMSSGFTVNDWDAGSPGSIGPFRLDGNKFQSTQTHVDSARFSLSVISTAGTIGSLNVGVRNPPPILAVQYVVAIHPDVIVKRSILEQFASYFVDMVTFNLGRSFLTGRPIVDEISVRIGPTLLLFGTALMVEYLIGILVGAVIAWRRGSKLELGTIVVTLFFYAMPVFWLGLVLLWIFAVNLKISPLGGMGGYDPISLQPLTGLDYVKDVAWHMALPLVTLVMIGMAGSILLMRSNMLEVMGEDYITTAKAKGLTERAVIYRHAARNALLPVVTAIAISIGFIISGGVLTETVFSWPGMGSYLVSRTLAQDFPAVQGAFFILAIMTIIANMFADVLYAYLDPRVRL